MSNKTDHQKLIEAFFDAIRLRHLNECQMLLRSLEAHSLQQPSIKPWCLYLRGILAFELECDWAEAERAFTELLKLAYDNSST